MEQQKFALVLQEAKHLVDVFNMFIEDVDLLADLHVMILEIEQALIELLSKLEAYQGDNLAEYMQGLDAVAYLDEVVDRDPMSDLEVQFFSAVKPSDEGEAAKFLMQVVARIELIYVQMVEKLHEFNALLVAD